MKNLIAELLVKLAQKEEESKELVAQVEALEIVVTALLRQMAQSDQQALINSVEVALENASLTHWFRLRMRNCSAIRKEAIKASTQLNRHKPDGVS
jgi:replication-associated recombination protein RarA